MQGLRQCADLVERGLHDAAYLFEILAQGWVQACDSPAGALQHGADGGEDLAEIVMQFARDISKSVFLNRDELLRQLAASLGERGYLFEQLAVVVDQIQAGGNDQNQHRGEK